MMDISNKTITRKIRKHLYQNKYEKITYQNLLHAAEAAQ